MIIYIFFIFIVILIKTHMVLLKETQCCVLPCAVHVNILCTERLNSRLSGKSLHCLTQLSEIINELTILCIPARRDMVVSLRFEDNDSVVYAFLP